MVVLLGQGQVVVVRLPRVVSYKLFENQKAWFFHELLTDFTTIWSHHLYPFLDIWL